MIRMLMLAAMLAALTATAPAQERTGEGSAASPTPRLYDVADLTPMRDADAPEDVPADPRGPVAIAQFLRAFVSPPLREDGELRQIGRQWIVALADAAQHRWIEATLAAARAAATQTIGLSIELWTMPDAVFVAHVEPKLKAFLGAGSNVALLADDAATDAFFTALGERKDVARLTASRLAVRPLSNGFVESGERERYVRDHRVTRVGDRDVFDPIVGTVWHGWRVEVAASPLERDRLGVAVDVVIVDLHRPIPVFTTTLAPGQPVSIQLPSTRRALGSATVAIDAGTTAVVVSADAGSETKVPGTNFSRWLLRVRWLR